MTPVPENTRTPRSWLWSLSGALWFAPLWAVYAVILLVQTARQTRSDARCRAEFRRLVMGLARRLIRLALAATLGWAGIGWLTGAAAPASSAPSPGPYLLTTLGLLAAAWLAGGLLIAGLLALASGARLLAERRRGPGLAADGLLWLAASGLAVPPGSAAVLAALVLGLLLLRPGEPPVLAFLTGGAALALLPALLAARFAWQARAEPDSPPASRPGLLLGLDAARHFTNQTGWLLGGTLIIEVVLGLPGLGRLVLEGLASVSPVALGVPLRLFALLWLAVRVYTILLGAAQQAIRIADGDSGPAVRGTVLVWRRGRGWLFLLAAVLALLAWLGLAVGPGSAPAQEPIPDPQAIYEARSAAYPLGTDHLGRDILGQARAALRADAAAALIGGLVALAFGGLWGGAAAAVRGWRGGMGDTLADLLRVPAEAALIINPALAVLLLTAGGRESSLLAVGAAIGLVLVPRLALAVEDQWEKMPGDDGRRRGGALAPAVLLFMLASFVALQYSVAIGTLIGDAYPGGVSLGSLLGQHQELIGGALIIPDGPFLRLGIALAAPGILASLALVLLPGAAADLSGQKPGSGLTRLLG